MASLETRRRKTAQYDQFLAHGGPCLWLLLFLEFRHGRLNSQQDRIRAISLARKDVPMNADSAEPLPAVSSPHPHHPRVCRGNSHLVIQRQLGSSLGQNQGRSRKPQSFIRIKPMF
ncbi:uncharacterized protein P174DRAFT_119830 [Aspergillus novofumigatus IBT 16806]|uniref:Uncharacterized protein n=1 Tax=Aspergillus novofumigatus (strain IBT 16806) TaxID=1392255 RepID=A0A2I1CBC4_ASPN1|nr:uncharacterized protein P174DRAFT_119830 [Aspergillus novofumigatus IBT 16806]PKX94935.1 hypothetical protein P174DRAFT_119830 [Aspergillus novofumigatus IBT 16806]